MIRKVATKDMSREQWLEERKKAIGGSDAGIVLGLSSYSSPYALWALKAGHTEAEDISDKEAVRLGNDLEQYVAERWTERTGKKLRRENHILYNDAYPFAHANIDRAVVGETDAGFEAKTTSSYDVIKLLEGGQIPDTWYCQITHYMMVTGAKRWYLGALAFGKGFYDFCFERNDDEIKALADAEAIFWRQVTTDTPPEIDGSKASLDAVKTIFAEADGTECDLLPVAAHLEACKAISDSIDALEKELADHKAHIMDYMGASEAGRAGHLSVTWKNQTRSTFDRKAWEKDHGKIPEQYMKQSTTRVFKLTEK